MADKMLDALKRLMADSEFVLKQLAENSQEIATNTFKVERDFSTLTDQNYKDAAYYNDTVSGDLIERLYELRGVLSDAIDDRED